MNPTQTSPTPHSFDPAAPRASRPVPVPSDDPLRRVADSALRAIVESADHPHIPALMQFTLADAAWLYEQGRPDLTGEVLAAWAAASASAGSTTGGA
ncbi:hypothetical protein SAMN05216184_104134 [Georgenia satyanarayanai]|uniref:Uncharacterized protein n=1 Tax=Georgenia satyanarayanai TaxID=860221 RepID=A0A2Y9AB19_9MICO|nr:hypothetical protein [Georgenia satyanarayanai]PYG00195.1 hypothetical protein A8987_104134 [Georgenia satyanarayanai]SSA40438.1 hypothetical protein SAMN05216184_104134 [Georgenia satyanarayanai]